MVETNTFGSTPLVLAEYGLADKAFEISKRAAELAREAAARFSTRERPRFVAGSMGPTTKAITVTGGVTFDELISASERQSSPARRRRGFPRARGRASSPGRWARRPRRSRSPAASLSTS